MKQSKMLATLLVINGIVGIAVGWEMLLTPVTMYASLGIHIDGMVNLLSDLRATGGALIVSGLMIVAGAFVSELRFSATIFSCLLYLGYGLSRSLAMLIDGAPANLLVWAAVVEVLLGALSLLALLKYREKSAI